MKVERVRKQRGCKDCFGIRPTPPEKRKSLSVGYPLDQDFYQTVKGIVSALPAVKTGVTIIIASECRKGIGAEELRACREEAAAGVEPALGDSLRDYGHSATITVIPSGPYVIPRVGAVV